MVSIREQIHNIKSIFITDFMKIINLTDINGLAALVLFS